MREERAKIAGNVDISEPVNLWGSIGGNVRVRDGGKLYVRGAIYGNLTVETGGRCHVFGNVQGNLIVESDAKVIHSGVLGGNAVNHGGRLYIDATAKIMGDVKSRSGGETRDSRKK
jgi:cytoskeletal protein CcmA (bactofilin family)